MELYAKAVTTDLVGDAWPDGGESWRVSIEARIAGDNTAAERRRAARAPVEVDARVRELGSEGCEAKVLNISATGFMAETAAEFEVGARVWLILPGRERANAVVRWCEGDRIGAEFAEPIDTTGLLQR
ncbi:PilZ domain-containing protein [Sphingomonas sp. BN140010]|uniref:PilZ domain-containing protein n=1 Tax=Sphingomonas arvum TaxID=2992113 RepID=A0ABT3JB63_9SPHN|nr:PilZ domain-containing protein [Sphingomonas sp. BN140010]MCW3796261.1 PilZ domain-containing protein [Sphingomonas sp. BN140010]